MFDFWLIISDFIELFLVGWRSIDEEDLIIQKHPVSHKTTTSCLKTEIQTKVVKVGSRDLTSVESYILEDIYNYLEGFCIQPALSTPELQKSSEVSNFVDKH